MVEQPPFADALRPHYQSVLRYCRWLCAGWQPTDAHDVLQQALLRALERYATLKDPNRFKPWLYRIVLRTYLMEKRRRFWQRFLPLEAPHIVPALPAVYPDEEHQEAFAHLEQALGQLSDQARTAILLYEVAGFSVEEIATIQQARSISAIKSRLSRARRKLRDALLTQGYTSVALRGPSQDRLIHTTLDELPHA